MRRVYEDVVRALQRYERVAVATVVRAEGSTPRAQGAKMLILPDGSYSHSVGGGLFESMVVQDAQNAMASGKSVWKKYSLNQEGQFAIGAICGGLVEVFIEVIESDPELYIVGGGHVGQALAHAALLLGFRITIFDDRPEYSTQLQCGDGIRCILVASDYSDIPEPRPNTYICLVSKGFVTDESALRRVIGFDVRYIGMIGSRRKVKTIMDHLEKDGIDRSRLDFVHAPIGVDIGSDSPQEIAISILAEIIRVKNKGSHGT